MMHTQQGCRQPIKRNAQLPPDNQNETQDAAGRTAASPALLTLLSATVTTTAATGTPSRAACCLLPRRALVLALTQHVSRLAGAAGPAGEAAGPGCGFITHHIASIGGALPLCGPCCALWLQVLAADGRLGCCC
jgi:hypothetical protein